MIQKQINIITHNGLFHSDEVFAIAFIQLMYKDELLNFTRTRDPIIIAQAQQSAYTFVLDVGATYNKDLRNFDHHQDDFQGEQSSFGLLIDSLSHQQIIDIFKFKEAFEIFKQQLVLPIDKWDNNIDHIIQLAGHNHIYSLQRIISSYNQSIPYGQKQEEAFKKAIAFAKQIIEKEIHTSKEVHFEKLMCEQYLADDSISINNQKAISKVFFSGFKSWAKQKGLHYMLIPIPNEELKNDYLVFSTRSTKYKLPPDSSSFFRHKSGFIILFKSYKNALLYFNKL